VRSTSHPVFCRHTAQARIQMILNFLDSGSR